MLTNNHMFWNFLQTTSHNQEQRCQCDPLGQGHWINGSRFFNGSSGSLGRQKIRLGHCLYDWVMSGSAFLKDNWSHYFHEYFNYNSRYNWCLIHEITHAKDKKWCFVKFKYKIIQMLNFSILKFKSHEFLNFEVQIINYSILRFKSWIS